MRPKDGIQAKLLRGFAFQSAVVLALAFASVMLLDWRRASRDLHETENGVRAALNQKGQKLAGNLSLVIRSLAEDNAIASIREIVDDLADQDSGIAYAAYVDREMKPWAFRSKSAYGRNADIRESLADSMSFWASRAVRAQSRAWKAEDGEILEFAAPVRSSAGIHGVVRVGLDMRPLRDALRIASEQAWQNRRLTMWVFAAAALCAFLLSLALSRLQSRRLTRPVLDLAESAKRIAGGDYSAEFSLEGDGEIALLAATFETMRRKIQAYTQRLETMVAEKVKQIGDLLENVDQGLFTFNPDLTVNPDHSARACSVLRLESLQGKSLDEVLRMSPAQVESFRDWTEVIAREHSHRRWSKLARLAPVREITLPVAGGSDAVIEIDYRKILDAGGRLARIMVLAQDVTEKRSLERRLREEKIRHESKVKIILGVSGHSEEMSAAFLKDTRRRLDSMLDALLAGKPDWKRRVFFDCHTLKGNAGGFGFDALAQAAQDLESLLGDSAGEPDEAFSSAMRDSLRTMDEERCKIEEVYRMIYGNPDKPPIRLDSDKAEKLRTLAQRSLETGNPGAARQLAEGCLTLRYRSFSDLASKYEELVARAAHRLGKDVEFRVQPPEIELDPSLMLRVDEALVHILRNALAHGIESPEIREQRGKGSGLIELAYARTGQGHTFSVRDDGAGIDGESLAKRAVDMGLLDAGEAARLGPEEKAQLIFMPGLSTARAADSIAGRGQGMAIAREAIHAEGGELTMESRAGIGTRFTFFLPDPHPEPSTAKALEHGLPIGR